MSSSQVKLPRDVSISMLLIISLSSIWVADYIAKLVCSINETICDDADEDRRPFA